MGTKELQEEVDRWIKLHKAGYWKPHEMLARIVEETGELAREINHLFGPKKKKSTEELNDISNELGDIMFSLCCMANSLGISLEDSFKRAMEKCYTRDKNRFGKKKSEG